MTTAEQLLAQGYAKGFAKSYSEGRFETLTELPASEFGDLPQHFISKLDNADIEQLERWVDRIMTATSLEDFFTD
ncbi:hypothetical protein [Nocardia panacis]|uniref:hypothetical protein n=1 Tax=Nocardia panacis TaxID=2340916 RepID=UPI0011C4611F|nr:hypothetical protein [Nocardia panacis]